MVQHDNLKLIGLWKLGDKVFWGTKTSSIKKKFDEYPMNSAVYFVETVLLVLTNNDSKQIMCKYLSPIFKSKRIVRSK